MNVVLFTFKEAAVVDWHAEHRADAEYCRCGVLLVLTWVYARFCGGAGTPTHHGRGTVGRFLAKGNHVKLGDRCCSLLKILLRK